MWWIGVLGHHGTPTPLNNYSVKRADANGRSEKTEKENQYEHCFDLSADSLHLFQRTYQFLMSSTLGTDPHLSLNWEYYYCFRVFSHHLINVCFECRSYIEFCRSNITPLTIINMRDQIYQALLRLWYVSLPHSLQINNKRVFFKSHAQASGFWLSGLSLWIWVQGWRYEFRLMEQRLAFGLLYSNSLTNVALYRLEKKLHAHIYIYTYRLVFKSIT